MSPERPVAAAAISGHVSAMAGFIRIAAALIEDEAGRLLLVRKRGTAAFMQAGGKIEGRETPFQALARELIEELGYAPAADSTRCLGRFTAEAANEPGHMVDAHLFRVVPPAEGFTLSAELDEGIWVTPEEAARLPLAPFTRDCVLPLAGR
jgi:8-oxo-dGTP pyrophosphatase MutT (NUDIX family)